MKITALLASLVCFAVLCAAPAYASDADDVTAILHEFLAASGEEVDVRVYGDTAIVAFKLVGTPADTSEDTDVLYYFNTGTFLKRDDVWKVVAWQATKIPPAEN